MNPESDEVKEWLQKARNDFLSARILMKHDPPVLDMGSFHCQQAVEKVLKAFLAWKAVRFEKVHSLTYLMDLCETEESGFKSLRERFDRLVIMNEEPTEKIAAHLSRYGVSKEKICSLE